MPELDAHCHFWKLDRGDYGWLSGQDDHMDGLRRDFIPEDLPENGAVLAIQSAPTAAETDYLLSLSDPRIAGVVGWVDLEAPGCAGHIADRASHPRFRGVRPMLRDIEATDWLLTAPRPDALSILAQMNLGFDAQITPRHLPVLAVFAAENPDLAIVIDHAARPRLARGGPDPEWVEGMSQLALAPNVHCKLSGLLTEMSPEQRLDPLPVLRPVMDQLLSWFGPSRLMWGSDWPKLNLAGDFKCWREITDELIADLSPDEQAGIMGNNAVKFYGLVVKEPVH